MVAKSATTALRKRGSVAAECSCDSLSQKKESLGATLPSKPRQQTGVDNVRSNTMRVFLPLLFVILVVKLAITTHTSSHIPSLRSPVQDSLALQQQRRRRNRFPPYGTDDFDQQCNWTLPTEQENPPCMILVRPPIHSNEGIADWASQIARAYLQARQVKCKLIFDYGLNVDIDQVLVPYTDTPIHNWTVPEHVECNEQCQSSVSFKFGNWTGRKGAIRNVPYYRHVFTFTHDWIYRGDYDYLSDTLPGFQLETGMACALGTLFQLSPHASQFEPTLFTTLLPALHDPNALVIALYMRTNHADVMALNEKRNETLQEEVRGKYNSSVVSFSNLAHCLERKYLSSELEDGVDIQRVYWMVLSDSPEAKLSMIEQHSGVNANEAVPVEERKWEDRIIERNVLVTGARGIHVRADRKPSTDEFAEAFLDWYLIGESDLVVTDMTSSFGPTGAMRTNRPLYRIGNCEPLRLIHELSEKNEKKKKKKNNTPRGTGGKMRKDETSKEKEDPKHGIKRGSNGAEREIVPK